MAQGKLKVKTKVPQNPHKKKKIAPKKGGVQQRRHNCPVAPKKSKSIESHKIRMAISKSINENIEQTLRAKALSSGKPFTMLKEASEAGPSKKKGKK